MHLYHPAVKGVLLEKRVLPGKVCIVILDCRVHDVAATVDVEHYGVSVLKHELRPSYVNGMGMYERNIPGIAN